MQPTAKPNYIVPRIEINWEISESRAFGKDTFTDLDFTNLSDQVWQLQFGEFQFLSKDVFSERPVRLECLHIETPHSSSNSSAFGCLAFS